MPFGHYGPVSYTLLSIANHPFFIAVHIIDGEKEKTLHVHASFYFYLSFFKKQPLLYLYEERLFKLQIYYQP